MTSRTLHPVFTLVLIFSLVSIPVGATVAPAQSPESVEQIGLSNRTAVESWLDETMADQLEQHHIPGAAVVIVKDGEPFLSKGYGYADLESDTPVVANETVFGIGSTSKLLTWTAVMQGVEDGRLNRTRDVNTYLNDTPVTVPDGYPQPVTLEHLGTHTAGFEDSFGGTLVSMLAVWTGGPVWRRVRGTAVPERRARLARGLLGVVSLLWLSVVVIFLLALVNFDAEVASPSLLLRVGQVLPYLGLAGTIGTVVAAGFAWREGYWNTPARLHYSLVAVVALVFAWQLYYLRILSL